MQRTVRDCENAKHSKGKQRKSKQIKEREREREREREMVLNFFPFEAFVRV